LKCRLFAQSSTLFLRKQTAFQLFSANTGGFYSENVSEITG